MLECVYRRWAIGPVTLAYPGIPYRQREHVGYNIFFWRSVACVAGLCSPEAGELSLTLGGLDLGEPRRTASQKVGAWKAPRGLIRGNTAIKCS